MLLQLRRIFSARAPDALPSTPFSDPSTPNSTQPTSPSSHSVSLSTSTILPLFIIFELITSFLFGLTSLLAPTSWGSDIDNVLDLLIADAYSLIPAFMGSFFYRFPFEINARYRFILNCFIHFIVLFGSTHLVKALNFSTSAALSFFKLLTAVVSLLVALLMIFFLPETLSLALYNKQLERDLFQKYCLLKEASKMCDAANQAKDELMAVLCHEIRNPLHCMCANADFLSENLDKITAIIEVIQQLNLAAFHQSWTNELPLERLEHIAQYVKSIQATCELMAHIVNDVLDISRLRSGHIAFEKTPVDLRNLVSLCVQHFQSIAVARKINLEYHLDPAVAPFVYCDRNRLHQLLFNLLSICMKSTKEGVVRVRVLTEKNCLQLDERWKKEGFVLLAPTSSEDGSSDEKKQTAAKKKEHKRGRQMVWKKGSAEELETFDSCRTRRSIEQKKTRNEKKATLYCSSAVDFLGIRNRRWDHTLSLRAIACNSNGREDQPDSELSKTLLAAPSSLFSNSTPSSISASHNSVVNAASTQAAFSSAVALDTAVICNATQQMVCLRFEDNGPGISESARKNLFTPFTSAKLTTIGTSEVFGLAIVQLLATIMKGTLTVLTKKDRGTIFTVTLAFELSNEAAVWKHAEEHNQTVTKLPTADQSERDRGESDQH